MFPENQVIKITDNVFIHNGSENLYAVWFKIDSQYFKVGEETDCEDDAIFQADMFVKALNKFKKVNS